MQFLEIISEQWQQQSVLEIIAFFLAIAYLWLAGQQSIWCWPAGLISTALYAVVYWEVSVVFQMLLNLYYMLMAVWGFYTWRKQGSDAVLVTRMSLRHHVLFIVLGSVMSVLVYYIAGIWFSYELISLDVSLTIFSLMATYLTVLKRLDSWVYWSLLNFTSIFLLWEKGLYLTILLMVIYIILAIRGYFNWNRAYQENLVLAKT
jgi:nicotinamide mononucleotide transporter